MKGASSSSPSARPKGSWIRRTLWSPHLLGLLWVLTAAAAAMAPALAHGTALGPFDRLYQHGLTAQPGTVAHNRYTADLITEMMPWAATAWSQVHHGHLPLWNPNSGLGMPLAFNWQSAPFSVPSLFGYLAPQHLAYTVEVLITLVVAGTGAYAFARVLGLGVLGCAMAGTAFELSGPFFFQFLGWPISSVMSWAGWLFAAGTLVIRGRRRMASSVMLAVALACAIYAGEPDALAVLIEGFALYALVILAIRARRARTVQVVVRPGIRIGLSAGAGLLLGAPLLLPGLQLSAASLRAGRGSPPAGTLRGLWTVVFQGFDGLPLAGNRLFAPYGTTVGEYLGVVAVVLAVAGAVRLRRRPEVSALGVTALVAAAIVFEPILPGILGVLPWGIRWSFNSVVLAFAVAMLAGAGADALVRSARGRTTTTWALGGFAATAVVLALVWLFGRGHLGPAEAHIRARSFIWPAVQVVVGSSLVGGLAYLRAGRRRRFHSESNRRSPARARLSVGAALLACQTAFLLVAGGQAWSSSNEYFATTPAVDALARSVGSQVVGFGIPACDVMPSMGIPQDANVAYGVHELDVYDPVVPRKLLRAWKAASGEPASISKSISVFCPAVDSVRLARLYGVGFILEPPGAQGPPGTAFVRRVGDETLYRVPGASAAVLVAKRPLQSEPSQWAEGTPQVVSNPDPASWRMAVRAPAPSVLRLHLLSVPGWHATIDGRPLVLRGFGGTMLEADIPAGSHLIALHYWPAAFTVGIALGGATVVTFLLALAVALLGRRRTAAPLPALQGEPAETPDLVSTRA